jgi:hypothetical protein
MGSTLEALYQQVLQVSFRFTNGPGQVVFDSELRHYKPACCGRGERVELSFSSGFKALGTVIGSDTDAILQ